MSNKSKFEVNHGVITKNVFVEDAKLSVDTLKTAVNLKFGFNNNFVIKYENKESKKKVNLEDADDLEEAKKAGNVLFVETAPKGGVSALAGAGFKEANERKGKEKQVALTPEAHDQRLFDAWRKTPVAVALETKAGTLSLALIDRDGNCLPRSVSLIVTGSQQHHERFRRLAVQYLRVYRAEFEAGFVSPRNETFAAYLDRMSRNAEHMDELELIALSTMFELSPSVYLPDPALAQHQRVGWLEGKHPCPLFYTGNYQQQAMHYHVLRGAQSAVPDGEELLKALELSLEHALAAGNHGDLPEPPVLKSDMVRLFEELNRVIEQQREAELTFAALKDLSLDDGGGSDVLPSSSMFRLLLDAVTSVVKTEVGAVKTEVKSDVKQLKQFLAVERDSTSDSRRHSSDAWLLAMRGAKVDLLQFDAHFCDAKELKDKGIDPGSIWSAVWTLLDDKLGAATLEQLSKGQSKEDVLQRALALVISAILERLPQRQLDVVDTSDGNFAPLVPHHKFDFVIVPADSLSAQHPLPAALSAAAAPAPVLKAVDKMTVPELIDELKQRGKSRGGKKLKSALAALLSSTRSAGTHPLPDKHRARVSWTEAISTDQLKPKLEGDQEKEALLQLSDDFDEIAKRKQPKRDFVIGAISDWASRQYFKFFRAGKLYTTGRQPFMVKRADPTAGFLWLLRTLASTPGKLGLPLRPSLPPAVVSALSLQGAPVDPSRDGSLEKPTVFLLHAQKRVIKVYYSAALFEAEKKALGDISSVAKGITPAVVASVDSAYSLVVSPCADATLRERLEFEEGLFWQLVRVISRVLEVMHSDAVRRVHLDLKPDNILLVENQPEDGKESKSDEEQVLVNDMASSKAIGDMLFSFVGSDSFASPLLNDLRSAAPDVDVEPVVVHSVLDWHSFFFLLLWFVLPLKGHHKRLPWDGGSSDGLWASKSSTLLAGWSSFAAICPAAAAPLLQTLCADLFDPRRSSDERVAAAKTTVAAALAQRDKDAAA